MRIALGNIKFPSTIEEAVELARASIASAAKAGAEIICFPEAFVPGLRGVGHMSLRQT